MNFRSLHSFGRAVGPIALFALMLVALLADADGALATTIQLGQLSGISGTKGAGCGSCNFLQQSTGPGAPSFTVPAGSWTLTSWSTEGGEEGGSVSLRVYRPNGKAGQYVLIGQTEYETVKAKKAPTFKVSIPVQPGDVIGMSTGEAGVPVFSDENNVDQVDSIQPGPPLGGTVGPGLPSATVSGTGRLNVTAKLTANTGPLAVTRSGVGSGAVTSAPAGIDCGPTCSSVFDLLTNLVLTATPTSGSEFAGWSGGGCTGLGTCSLSLQPGTSVDARFDPSHALVPGKLKRQPSKARARLTVQVPGPGALVLSGKGIAKVTRQVAGAGNVVLPVAATGKAKRALISKGHRKFGLALTFTPNGGTPGYARRAIALQSH